MIPLYLAEMASLPTTDPDINSEFLSGNWVVNKNQNVPFCALGADHGLEHINRSMTVNGGLVGITLTPAARSKFFLIAPAMSRLAEQAKEMAGVSSKKQTRHHCHNAAVLMRENKNINILINTVETFTNPFTDEGNDLYNLVTKVVMPEKIKNDLCKQAVIGQTLSTRLSRTVFSQRRSIYGLR